eukprot:scaffold1988_cov255-Pinguiococcus_pyrenoidosus.AAC.15
MARTLAAAVTAEVSCLCIRLIWSASAKHAASRSSDCMRKRSRPSSLSSTAARHLLLDLCLCTKLRPLRVSTLAILARILLHFAPRPWRTLACSRTTSWSLRFSLSDRFRATCRRSDLCMSATAAFVFSRRRRDRTASRLPQ